MLSLVQRLISRVWRRPQDSTPINRAPINMYQRHLLLLLQVGRTCRRLPRGIKSLVWQFLRNPAHLEIVDREGNIMIFSMQTGKVLESQYQRIRGWTDDFGALRHSDEFTANLQTHKALAKRQHSLYSEPFTVRRQMLSNGFRIIVQDAAHRCHRYLAYLLQCTLGQQGIHVGDRRARESEGWVILERLDEVIHFDAFRVAVSANQKWAVVLTDAGAEVVDLQSGHSTVIHPPSESNRYPVMMFSIIDDILLWVPQRYLDNGDHAPEVAFWNCSNPCVPQKVGQYCLDVPHTEIVSMESNLSAVAIEVEVLCTGLANESHAVLLIFKERQKPYLVEVGRVKLAAYMNHGVYPLGPQLLATWDAYGLLAVWRFSESKFRGMNSSVDCIFRKQFDGFAGPGNCSGSQYFDLWPGVGPQLPDLVGALATRINDSIAQNCESLQNPSMGIASEDVLAEAREEDLPNHSEHTTSSSQHSKEAELETALAQSMGEEELRAQEAVYVAEAILRSKADAFLMSADCVVLMRLKRLGQAAKVRSTLLNSAHLKHARELVVEAGCEVLPQWCPAVLLVPLTQESLAETGVELRAHHIVARQSDFPLICQALSEIPRRQRPTLWAPAISTDSAEKGVAEDEGNDAFSPDSLNLASGFGSSKEKDNFAVEIVNTFVHLSLPKDIPEASEFADSDPCASGSGLQPPNPRRWKQQM